MEEQKFIAILCCRSPINKLKQRDSTNPKKVLNQLDTTIRVRTNATATSVSREAADT